MRRVLIILMTLLYSLAYQLKLFSQSNNFLNLSLYYTHTSNSIQILTVNQPGCYTLTTPQNIATDRALGSDVIYRFNIKKTENFTITFDLSYNKFDGTGSYASNLNGFSNYCIHLEGSINLHNKFIFLHIGNHRDSNNPTRHYEPK